jgi:hypothetical protein
MKAFILYNVNIDTIDSKYGFQFKSNIESTHYNNNTTNIEELNKKDKHVTYSFYDTSKKSVKCVITLTNLINNPLPPKTNIMCYWCKHTCPYSPIGCPIKYSKSPKKHYVVDGIFCSFNCCASFINENSHITTYNNSMQLLHKMCNEINDSDSEIIINPAPNWRLLNIFGGNLSIEEFRHHFKTYSYKDIENYITSLPHQLPISWLYEEKVIF